MSRLGHCVERKSYLDADRSAEYLDLCRSPAHMLTLQLCLCEYLRENIIAMHSSEELAEMMAAYALNPEGQLHQTRFRMQLIEEWQIPAGARILEVGCGQGDMTAVLANAVGRDGLVTAVDLAKPTYGAPVTLEDSARKLMTGPLGRQIEFRFQFDVLDPLSSFPNDAFDAVVFAHCTWYFHSPDRLREILFRVRPWAERLCLSEWDLEPHTVEQIGHLLAVLIQGQIESFKPESQSNIRSPYSRVRLGEVLKGTGWDVTSDSFINSAELQDAKWEIASCLTHSLNEASRLNLPPLLHELLRGQVDVLQRLVERGDIHPLPSYSITATRSAH